MELVIEIAGWIAAGVLLGAYGLLSRGKLSGQGSSFQSLNVVGSLLVGLNSLAHEAWPSVSVNVVWLVIGVATLVATRRAAPVVAPAATGLADERGTRDASPATDPNPAGADAAAQADPVDAAATQASATSWLARPPAPRTSDPSTAPVPDPPRTGLARRHTSQ